jgi:hypothetical protein
MRKVKEVLRLRYDCSLSLDAIARALSLFKGVVAKYVKNAELANLDWTKPVPWTRWHWPIGLSLSQQSLLSGLPSCHKSADTYLYRAE